MSLESIPLDRWQHRLREVISEDGSEFYIDKQDTPVATTTSARLAKGIRNIPSMVSTLTGLREALDDLRGMGRALPEHDELLEEVSALINELDEE